MGFLRGVGGWYIGRGVVVFRWRARRCASISWFGLAEGLLSRCGVYTGWGGKGGEVLGREEEEREG